MKQISTFMFVKPVLFAGLAALALSACLPAVTISPMESQTPPAPSPTTPGIREAQVEQIEIQASASDPEQVRAVVRGTLSGSCTKLGQSQVEYAAGQFLITLPEEPIAEQECVGGTIPFETTVLLSASGLPAGTYSVVANGMSADFTLQAVAAASPAPPVPATIPPTAASHSDNQVCRDAAKFVADVSVPDDIVLAPNAPFIKIWRLQNTGTCTWNHDYLVHYVSGATMSQSPGYYIVEAGQTVSPGETVDIAVGMTSPVQSGTYQSYWGLKKENGKFIPVQGGANGNSFYVRIKVNESTADGQVTAASIDITLEQGSGSVCTPEST
jgi:hypothetical protein